MRKPIFVLLSVCSLTVFAQDNPLSTANKGLYQIAKNNLVKAADKMPEEHYGFKPAPEVKTFGQIVGHVADSNYMFCSAVLGEKAPVTGIEKSKTTKADLVTALQESFTYCDKAYEITDAAAAQTVKFFGQERPKLSVLQFNNMHDYEHYGNLVTYMRIKSIVPPSSERNR